MANGIFLLYRAQHFVCVFWNVPHFDCGQFRCSATHNLGVIKPPHNGQLFCSVCLMNSTLLRIRSVAQSFIASPIRIRIHIHIHIQWMSLAMGDWVHYFIRLELISLPASCCGSCIWTCHKFWWMTWINFVVCCLCCLCVVSCSCNFNLQLAAWPKCALDSETTPRGAGSGARGKGCNWSHIGAHWIAA